MKKTLLKKANEENRLMAYYGCTCTCGCVSCATSSVPDHERMRLQLREVDKVSLTNRMRDGS